MSLDDDLGAELAAAHERAEQAQAHRRPFDRVTLDDIADAVLLLHGRDGSGEQCKTCHDAAGLPELYPCPTLRTVRRIIRIAGNPTQEKKP